MAKDPTLLYVNGMNGTRGGYLIKPLSPKSVLDLALADERGRGDHAAELDQRHTRDSRASFQLDFGLDPRDLAQTGWGVILPHDLDPAVREAIAPLLDLRRRQATAGGRESFYREYVHEPDESKQAFLGRNGVSVGMPANPQFMPYYLLIVGDPERITYRFQYEMDVEFAVGRIAFATPQEYHTYARSVVAAETGGAIALPRKAAFFASRNHKDRATQLSSESLVPPLRDGLATDPALTGWDITSVVGDEMTKDRLAGVVNGGQGPALLFTASHGMGFDATDPRQLRHQGALLTSECPNPFAPIDEKYYLSADDVGSDARLLGSMAFFFACYGAGTPRLDDFPHEVGLRDERQIAPRAFVAPLPQRLLGHPNGGALAVVGHVERAWASSFLLDPATPQLQAFRSTLKQLLLTYPVGAAMEWFNQRYAALATALTTQLRPVTIGASLTPTQLLRMTSLWTDHNDARSYVILGDPAVRLNTTEDATPTNSRSTLEASPDGIRHAMASGPDAAPRTTRIPEIATGDLPPDEAPGGGGAAPEAAPSPARPPIPADLLAAAEARFRAIQATGSTSFTVESTAAATDLLGSNPPEAIARRLRRAGLEPSRAEAVAELAARDSFVIGPRADSVGLVGLERLLGQRNMLLGIQYLDNGRLAARTVGRILIRNASGSVIGFGTGSLVSPRLLLTNNHVLDSAATAERSAVQFDYQAGPDGRLLMPAQFTLDPAAFFFTSPYAELDFTLVAVAATSQEGQPLDGFGHNRLGATTGEILAGESVTIIQHPNGEPKQIALRENLVLKVPQAKDRFLHYQTDTNPGSSGSPVYNDQWEVVALHHAGFPRKDDRGRILARDGRVWTESMGEQAIDWIANEGVRVAAIIERLRADTRLEPSRRRLLEPILEAASAEIAGPSAPGPAPGLDRGEPEPLVAPAGKIRHSASVVAGGGEPSGWASWTIPIEITLRVEAPTAIAMPDVQVGEAKGRPAPPAGPDGA